MKKNQIVLLIVAVVVLGGAVSGAYYYQTQKTKNQVITPTTTTNQEIKNEAIQTIPKNLNQKNPTPTNTTAQPTTQTPPVTQDPNQGGIGNVPAPRFAEAKQKCINEGLTIERRQEDMGSWTAAYDICIFPNGSECESLGYLEGTCKQSQFKTWSMLNPVAF